MITYGSTTLTSYNTITKIEVYYYKSTSATDLAGGSWSTTKPTWENGKYIWQKIKTTYEGKLENGQFYSESDPVNITGQQGATGTAAYSYKLNASDSVIGKTKTGEYTIDKITFTATYKQGTGAVTAYTGRFKIETTTNGTTWTTQYTSSGNESSKEYTIPENIISVRCSLYQSGGTSTLLDIVTIPVVKDGVDAIGLRDSIPYYLASDKQTGVTRLDQGWTRFKPELTTEKRYLWVYYVSRYSEGDTQPELIEIKNDIVSFENHGDESPVENCVIDIEPVQDLNGYDHPWPAGGGKNILPPMTNATESKNGVTFTRNANGSISMSGTISAAAAIYFVDFTLPAGSYTFSNIGSNTSVTGANVDFYIRDIDAQATLASINYNTSTDNRNFTLSATTNIRFYTVVQDGATISGTIYPMIRLSSVTDATYAPYSNICPITSFAGENLWDEEWELGTIRQSDGLFAPDDTRIRSKNFNPCVPETTYYVKDPTNGNNISLRWYDANEGFISSSSWIGNTTITSPVNAYYFAIVMASAYGTTYNHDISINYPASFTNYIPRFEKNGITAHVTRVGKNLFDLRKFAEVYPNKCAYNEETGELAVNTIGGAVMFSVGVPVDMPFDVLGNGCMQYEAKNGTGTNFRIRLVYEDGSITEPSGTGTNTDFVTTSSDINGKKVTYVRFNWSTSGTFVVKNLVICSGTAPTAYESYTGDTYSITLPTKAGTVYGGTLDIINGKLVVDKILHTITKDANIYTWGVNYQKQGVTGFYSMGNVIYPNDYDNILKSIKCNMLPCVSNNWGGSTVGVYYNKGGASTASWYETIAFDNNSLGITNSDTNETAIQKFKTLLEETPLQIVNELTTPFTYTLTPQEITMLTGQNHIFSDTGQTAISYYDSQTSTDPYVDYSATSTFEVAQSVSDAVGTLQAPYKEVEWVESTGKQYVYLDWKPPIKTWGFEIDFLSKNATGTSAGAWNETTNVNGYGNIFGVRSASGINNVQLSSYSNGLLRVGNGTNIATGFKTDHTRQTIKLHNSTITKTDGTTATITRVDEDSSKNYCNMTIFALYNDALRRRSTCSINEPSSTRIYSLKFYDGDTLTVDLVGAIRKADKVTGLYDKVSKHFYPAPGMLYGNDVGDIIIDDTITENLNKTDVKATVINKNRSRMWEANVPFSKLEDGQKITVTYSYGGIVGSVETTELVGWDDTSSNYDVYLKLVFPNGDKTEWIPCYYSNTSRLTTHYSAGTPITFTYHENLLQNATETAGGSAVVRGFFANASYYNNTSYTQYSNNVVAGANGIKAYALIMQDDENTWSCFYSGAYKSTNTGKPAYTGGFMLGKILYSSGSGAQTSNSSLDTYYNYKEGVVTSTIYDAYPLDLRYSTNCATTLTAQRPVYIVGTIENDGLFHLDVSQWWTQTKPTYEDGKVYVYLGVAYSTYQVWLATENPAYIYYDNEFILYDKALTLQNIATLRDSLETQIDGKVETWCQKTNPASSWNATERISHTGDLWYYIGESDNTYKNNTTYQYNGSTNTWTAYSANPDLFDKIDGKAAIYYGSTSSVTSAETGDYLVDSSDGSSYRWDGSKWVKVTDYKTAIDNIEIGGRNLLLNTADLSTHHSIGNGSDVWTFENDEASYTSTTKTWPRLDLSYNSTTGFSKQPDMSLMGDTYLTLSIDAKCEGDVNGVFYLQPVVFGDDNTRRNFPKSKTTGNNQNVFTLTNEWKRYSFTISADYENDNDWTYDSQSISQTISGFGAVVYWNSTGTVHVRRPKLECGNKPTGWTPAPEDVTRGTGFYAITTAPTAYTTTISGFTPAYRIALSTVKTQSGLKEVMVGDVIQQGYNTYPVGYVDASYVYLGSANSIRGATGATGLNNAQVILYRRFASAPSGTDVAPTGDVTYTFSTGKATNNLNSWTQNIPSGSDPVYMIAASASSTSSTDTIPKTEWSAPVKILENGQNGGTGSAGADGYNQATIFLYQRKSGTAPSKPSSAVTYTFSSGALSSTPTGWSRTIPTNDGNPCYVTTATAVAKTATYSIPANGWSDVVVLSENGISVTNVTSTNNTTDGGTSVITITLSDGTTKTFNVKNGSKGNPGNTGATAEWYYGTDLTHTSGTATLAPSSTSGAVVGSMYLNTKTSLVYKCTAVGTNNTWTYAGDLTTGVIDNLQVGGKNLLLKEPRAFDPVVYNPYQLNLTEPLEANQPYTIQLWDVDVSNDQKTAHTLGVNVYYCGGSVTFGNWTGEQYFTDGHADHLTLTFTPTETNVTHSSVNNTTGAKYISLYNSVSNVDGSVKNLTIGKWQLEKGNVGTDWTLAPEDVENAIQSAQDKADEAWAATQPLAIKTYNDVTITNNNDPNGWLYFGTVKPTDYNTPWKIRYKVYASINGITDSYQQSEVMIEGAKDTYYTYRTYNMISNTNYRPLYAYSLYTLKQAGVNNGYGHLIGIRFQSAYWPNSTYTNYKRTIKIEIIESTNCQITLADIMFLYTDASGTGSTNYNTRYSFDGTTQGYTGSGDRNETNHILNNFSGKTGALGIWSAGLFMCDENGTYQNICTDSAGAISRTVNTTKKPNPNGFEIGSQIYYSPWNTYNANSNINGSVYASYGAFDSRYSLNTTLTTNCLTPYEPVYLVGTVRTDGLYYLDTVWWTQTPTDSSKTYVLIGGCYDSTTSYCRINLFEDNNWYKYVNGKLEDYTNRLAELAATTATAYITDTTNNGIMVHPENDTTSGWSIAGAIELFKSGISYIKLWIDNNIPKIRIGKEDSKHVLIDNDSVDIVDNNTILASFGETARIGKENQGHITIDNDSVDIKKDNNLLLATFGANGLATYVGSGESVFLITTQADTSTATQKTESVETAMPNATLVLSYPPAIGTTATFEVTITSPSLNYTFTDTVHITEPEEGVIVEPGDHEAVSEGSSIVIQRSYDFPRRRTYIITQIEKDDVIINNANVTITANYTAKAAAMEYRPSYTLGTRASYKNEDVGVFSFAEGDQVIAKGYASHAEGQATTAIRDYSHAEGKNTTASGYYSHSEGYETASGSAYTHAEGCRTIASSPGSHAEGQETTASGSWSHAEGYATTASGYYSHSEGYKTIASNFWSHAQNYGTQALSKAQTTMGKWNIADNTEKYALIIGNGSDNDNRSNALTVAWDGDTEFALDTTASSGTIDADLYDAITALGWENDVTA